MTSARRPRPRPPRLITVEQAAGVLGVSKMSVYRRLQEGLIVGYRVGPNRIAVDAESVDRFLKGSRIVPDWAEW